MNLVELKALQVLIAVDRHGGFAAAARDLGLTRAAVSRAIGGFERRIGVRLARRTTRRVVLTEAAQALVRDTAEPLARLADALVQAADQPARVSGTVRLACSSAFGRDVVLPLVLDFQRRHPAVRVDVRLNDRIDDLIAEPIDVAVRLGPLVGSSMVARPVGALKLVVVAAPDLLRRHRPPRTLEHLTELPTVGFRVPGTGAMYTWPLIADGKRHQGVPQQVAFEVDSIDAVATLVRCGAGLGLLPQHLVAKDLAEGTLVSLLPQAIAPGPEVHVCYASRRLVPARVRALIEHLVQSLPVRLRETRRVLRHRQSDPGGVAGATRTKRQ